MIIIQITDFQERAKLEDSSKIRGLAIRHASRQLQLISCPTIPALQMCDLYLGFRTNCLQGIQTTNH